MDAVTLQEVCDLIWSRPQDLTLIASARSLRQLGLRSLESRLGGLAVVTQIPSHPAPSIICSLWQPKFADRSIIAIGGGSVIDTAKIFKCFGAGLLDPNSFSSNKRSLLPMRSSVRNIRLAVVPTTFGTGSEVTPTASLWPRGKPKFSIEDDFLLPDQVMLAPDLLMSLPISERAAGICDIIGHAVDAFWNVNSTSQSDQWAEEALGRTIGIARSTGIDAAVAAPSRALTHELQKAGFAGGKAIALTRSGLTHSISYPLTRNFGLPHGLAVGVGVLATIRVLADRIPARAAALGKTLNMSIPEVIIAVEGVILSNAVASEIGRHVQIDAIRSSSVSYIDHHRSRNSLLECNPESMPALVWDAIERIVDRSREVR